jgi:hypothetical protein
MLADTYRKLENRRRVLDATFETLPLKWCEDEIPDYWMNYEERTSQALESLYPDYDMASREILALTEAVVLARFGLLFGEEIARGFVLSARKEPMREGSDAFIVSRRFAEKFGEAVVREIASAIYERAAIARHARSRH